MDESEISQLCKQLETLIALQPGANPEALKRARRAIETLHSANSGDHVNQKLFSLIYGFEQWFSPGKWDRRGDNGALVKQHLEDDLAAVWAAMWRRSQGDSS